MILGFGISSFCFLLYLYNENLLKKHRILICEENNEPCLNSLNYKNVNSNSTLRSLLEPFRIEMFSDILTKVDRDYDLDCYINLSDYNKIVNSMAKVFLSSLDSFSNIDIKLNFRVDNISHGCSGIRTGKHTTKTCIISMGAKQDINQLAAQDTDGLLKDKLSQCVLPHDIFTNEVDFDSFNNKKIAVIGSSHSSLSVVDALLSKKINPKNISLLCKNDFKVFFDSRESCLRHHLTFNEGDVCTETQTINRFDGLRENSKEIYLNLSKYGINKHCSNKISCEDFDIIVPCWGYYKKLPKINKHLYKNAIDSNENFELTVENKSFSKIFSLGIGSNPKIKITQKNFKRSIDGVWLYYNLISKPLYENLLKNII